MEWALGLLKAAGSWSWSNISGILVGIAIPILFKVAKNKIPKMIGELVADKLSEGFKKIKEEEDLILRGLYKSIAIDLVKLAEHLIPEPKAGPDKYALVAGKLCKIIPFLKGRNEEIEEIIEAAVKEMKEELKRSAQN